MSGRDPVSVAPTYSRAPGGDQEPAAGGGPAIRGGIPGRPAPTPTGDGPPGLVLSEEQADGLAACIGRSYSSWRIWRAHGVWYATGPCPGCGCTQTLHARTAGELCEQLATAEQAASGRQAS
ncbi:hypothetical protein HS041_27990 [Planomonospora sp. ID67723]|uniref:hypothetical protein n=1 Tax=Planomonospora sp. ID67723 TaxID=2738134 RepID=UPI0018C407F2|nr:hypothetical protein [Planomonospora sp. ID67723]MBG0831579.1 hypothetical protein [Planomonospora sp. ID67723]